MTTTPPDRAVPRRRPVAATSPVLAAACAELKEQAQRAHLAHQAWEQLTPDEQHARLEARRTANLERWRPALEAHTRLLDRARGVERELLEMHGPVDSGWGVLQCQGCEYTGYDAEPPEWWCATYRVVAHVSGASFKMIKGVEHLFVPDHPMGLPPVPPTVTDP